MKLAQTQKQSQILTAALQQSLTVLQLSVPELQEYITDKIVENPMVDLNRMPELVVSTPEDAETEEVPIPPKTAEPSPDDAPQPEEDDPAQQETFVSHLKQQLPQISRYLPDYFLPICDFMIESLDRRGYLNEPVDLLAAALNISVSDAMQALYAVQSLSPTGVGARSLEECLILQLAEGPYFNQYTLAIIREHLDELARRDFDAISAALHISVEEVQDYFKLIRSLNPIPSNGFRSVQSDDSYVVPEAYVEVEGGNLTIRYNEEAVPTLPVSREYLEVLETTDSEETRAYLTGHYDQLKKLQRDLEKRQSTMLRLITYIVSAQQEYLLGRSRSPAPLSVQEIADALDLHPSTVSHGVSEKYLSVSGHVLPLKTLLHAQIGNGIPASTDMLRVSLMKLIDAEDKTCPLDDESLSAALETVGIHIPQNAVPQYRREFNIPEAEVRKLKNDK